MFIYQTKHLNAFHMGDASGEVWSEGCATKSIPRNRRIFRCSHSSILIYSRGNHLNQQTLLGEPQRRGNTLFGALILHFTGSETFKEISIVKGSNFQIFLKDFHKLELLIDDNYWNRSLLYSFYFNFVPLPHFFRRY